jgi:predicted DNA binding CopG/RHH family protein
MISIRLPNPLIDDFKFIADTQGLRYQTLMRQVLVRFADSELKRIVHQAASDQMAIIKLEEADGERKTG